MAHRAYPKVTTIVLDCFILKTLFLYPPLAMVMRLHGRGVIFLISEAVDLLGLWEVAGLVGRIRHRGLTTTRMECCCRWKDAFSFYLLHLGHLHWWSCSRGRTGRCSIPLHLWCTHRMHWVDRTRICTYVDLCGVQQDVSSIAQWKGSNLVWLLPLFMFSTKPQWITTWTQRPYSLH